MTHVRTSTTFGRRPPFGGPSPLSRCPAGPRRSAPTFTLRCKRHGQSPTDHQAWVQAQKLLSRRLAQRRGQGPHPPDRPAGGVLPPGHQHPPVLLQPGRPDPPVLPPQPAALAQLDGHQQGLQRLQAGGLPLRDPGSSGCCHRRLPGLRTGRGQLAQPQPPGPGAKNQAPGHSPAPAPSWPPAA